MTQLRRLFHPDDRHQAQRLRLTLLALVGGGVHVFLVWLALRFGFFWAGSTAFAVLVAADLLGRLTFVILILTGVNQRFREPGMTLAQMAWSTLCVLAAVYFIDQVRLVLLMFYLQVMLFGAFQLRRSGFLFITALAVLGYALVIALAWQRHPVGFDLRVELIQWLGFALVMASLSAVGTSLNNFLRLFRRQNRELKQALKRIEELAVTDELTGLANRRHILEVVAEQAALARRQSLVFSVCFLDLDHFKRVNDTHGHQAGDRLLAQVAQVISSSVREVDRVARFGGEEFLVVLTSSSLDRSQYVAERIRRRLETFDFGDIAPRLKVTVSIGVAEYIPGEKIEALISRADQALYEAKRDGRNRTVCRLGPTSASPTSPRPV